ncbi:MAG: hypothetical protein ACHQT7_00340 [Candidatus Levyibacteriota bacterium]
MEKLVSQNKYLLTTLAVFILTIGTNQALAASEHTGGNETKESQEQTVTVTPSPTGTVHIENDCDGAKNHGGLVSCVAHEHEGGSVVSAIAKSDDRKKEDNDSDERGSVIVTPTVTPTASVTPSVTETPTTTVTPTLTETPTVSPTAQLTSPDTNALLTQLRALLKQLEDSLRNLASQLHV